MIDSHFHVFSAHCGDPGSRYVPTYDASLPMWTAAANPLGVRRGVLVQTSFMGLDNSRLLQELDAHPGVLRGVAVVGPDTDPNLLAQWDALGVRGIRLNLAGASHEAGAWAHADRLWAALQQLGWHVEVHNDVGRLPEVLRWLPQDMPLVIDHMGKPDATESGDPTISALSARARRCPVHIKLSGAYRLAGRDARSLARIWLHELGSDRLLWGSDWPCTNHESMADYGQLLHALHDWLGDTPLEPVLTWNPERLYGFGRLQGGCRS